MGQKVHPHGLRVGVIKDWDSRWFVKDKDMGDTIVADYNLRKYLKKTLYAAGIPRIEIERDASRARVTIHCAKPGIIIGKGGAEIGKLEKTCEKILGKPTLVNIIEVRSPDVNAQLVAENVAAQLEKRISFRRAMKQAIGRAMKLGAKGIKTQVSGRLGGAEIARTEHYHEGTIPLQTLRADIDYGFAEAHTTYGRIGIKIWIYRGEVLAGQARAQDDRPPRRSDRPRSDRPRDDRPRGDRRDGPPRGDRRDGPPRDGAPRNDRPRDGAPRSDQPRSDRPRSDRPRAERPPAPAQAAPPAQAAGTAPAAEPPKSEE